jgi:hypothetical protein
MLSIMNEGVPYGHLNTAIGPVSPKFLAECEHIPASHCQRLLTELEENKVFSRTDDGVIFSRRMVRDEEIRLKRASGGYLGGNPNLTSKVGLKVNLNGYPPPRARASDSGSVVGFEVKNSEDAVLKKYEELVEAGPTDRREVDLGAQIWIQLVESREITGANVAEVFAGLERWKASEQWRKDNGKYIPSIAKWLQKRAWKDYPKQAEVNSW